MSPTQIGILILVGIAILLITAYIAQTLEMQRRARRMRLLALKDQIRRAEHLLSSLPAFYVTPAIRAALIQYMRWRWQQVMELDRSPSCAQELERLKQLASEQFEPGQYPPGALTYTQDRDSARHTRALLRELARFLADLQKADLFTRPALLDMVRQIKQGYTRLTIELEIMDAQQTEAISGPQVALHAYRNALSRLLRFEEAHQIDAQTQALAHKVAQCEQAADKVRLEAEQERLENDRSEHAKAHRERYP